MFPDRYELPKNMPGDPGPVEYYATIGGLESIHCNFMEYEGRLYCTFPLNKTYYNTAQKFDLFIEGCPVPIFGHPYLSIMVETQPPDPKPDEPEEMPCTACHTPP